MAKLVSSLLITLDGFVAGPNGELNMFPVDEQFFDFSKTLSDRADTALYGKGTYAIMESYWPTAADAPNASKHDIEHAAWYKRVDKIVLSTTLESVGPGARILRDNVADEINRLKKEQEKDIQIFGSPGAVSTLTQDNLIDEYWLFVAPILLGHGKRAFSTITERVNLNLLSSEKFNSGIVLLHYAKKV